MQAEINTLTSTRVPRSLTELITLGRTLKRRAGDILAYFDHPHTSNGPTEAINAPLEHQRSCAPGLSKTSPTTSPAASSKPEDSDPNYTLNYEEPLFADPQRVWSQAGGHVLNLSIILCMGLEVGGDSIWLVTAGI